MNADTAASVASVAAVVGASVAYVLRRALRPVQELRKDLAPLTERNSDGLSVFDEVRAQQKKDTITLQELADEFPKNGVPTRAVVDALVMGLAEVKAKIPEIVIDVAEVKATVRAHDQLHRMIPPQRRDHS